MRIVERYSKVMAYFEKIMPPTDTELNYRNTFELLVAVMLSAQCTDKRINKVTPKLFLSYPTPEIMAKANESEVYEYIKSVSYPNSKAKHLVEMARMLTERFEGKVPNTREELTQLPGVGRKTANVILALAYKEAAMAVDTHVFRVSHRLGLVPERCKTPLSVETELIKHINKEKIHLAHFWLLYHGRYTCMARKPKCQECELSDLCKYKTTIIQKTKVIDRKIIQKN